MNKNDWYEAGDQIKKLVQDAVDSGDYSQLGNTISNVVNDTLDGLQSVLKENLGNAQQAGRMDTGYGHNEKKYSRSSYEYTNREAAERIRRNMQERRRQRMEQDVYGQHGPDQRMNRDFQEHRAGHVHRTEQTDRMYRPVKVRMKVPGEISGQIMKWTGYSFSGMFGLSLGILGAVSLATGFFMSVPIGILAVLFGTSMWVGVKGSKKAALAKRFRRYTEVLGERTYCLVEELASAVGQNCRFVQKDLKKMISQGFFKEGYLDRKETLLITDKTTYQQYLTAQTEYEKRAHAEELKRSSASDSAKKSAADAEKSKNTVGSDAASKEASNTASNKKLTPECQELIAEGKRYIQYVHECNDRIPGETMSAKLDRLELVITRIFREAERNPEIVTDLKKLMSYYLPTTKKLLDTYCELDMQPIRGQNIETTKKEIEDVLDTVNAAFENLLDGLFEETAWDISSDISVLNTMLAQEGLTGKDFERK